jgi:hypothetical protein
MATFSSGFEAGLQLRKYLDEKNREKEATEIYNRNYGKPESKPTVPDGFAPEQPVPVDYTQQTGFGGQQVMMPKGAIAMTAGTTNEEMQPKGPAGMQDGDVTTYPYQPGEPVQNVSPVPTSPFNTTQPVSQEAPDYSVKQVTEPSGPAMPNAITQDQSTISQDYTANAPQEVKDRLASAQTEDEYNSILNDYKKSQQPRESSFYDKTVAEVTSAKSKVDANQEELARIKKTANDMRAKGLWKEAQNFETKAVETQKNYYEATNEYNKVVGKALDLKAGLAQSYLNALESGTEQEFAFNQTLMRARALGIPDLDQYRSMDPSKRVQAAQMIVDDAVTTKDRLRSDIEIMKVEAKKAQFNKTLAQKDETLKMKDRWHSEDRDLKSRSLDIKAVKTNFDMANQTVKNTQRDLKMIQDRLDLIKSGAVIKDDFGNIMSPAESQREAAVLTQQRENFQDRLVAAEEHAANVKKYIPTKELKEIEKADKVSKLAPKDVNLLVTAINSNPDQLELIRKNFEDLHPGLKLEDYVKLNTPGKKPVDNRETLKSFEGSPNRVKVDVTKSSKPMEKTYRDPITGQEISRSEFRKKYGENPK